MEDSKQTYLGNNPRYRQFLWATTTSFVGTGILDIALPLYIYQLTQSVFALSLAGVAVFLPHFLMAPLTGYIADGYPRRRVLLYSDLGQVAIICLLFAYLQTGAKSYLPILVAVFLAKSFHVLFETVCHYYVIPGLSKEGELEKANAWFLSFYRIIQTIAPLIGGVLLTYGGIQACLIANLVSFAATLWFTLQCKELDPEPKPIKASSEKTKVGGEWKHLFTGFGSSVREVLSTPLFRSFTAMMFFWNLSTLTLNSPTLIYFFNDFHSFSAASYGMVLALSGVFGVVGYMIAGRWYRTNSFAQVLAVSCFAQATLSTLAVAVPLHAYVFASFYALSRLGGSVLGLGTFLLRQTAVPKARIATTNATMRMLFMSAAPLSALGQGALLKYFGLDVALSAGAVCLWIAVWYAYKTAYFYEQSFPRVFVPTMGQAGSLASEEERPRIAA